MGFRGIPWHSRPVKGKLSPEVMNAGRVFGLEIMKSTLEMLGNGERQDRMDARLEQGASCSFPRPIAYSTAWQGEPTSVCNPLTRHQSPNLTSHPCPVLSVGRGRARTAGGEQRETLAPKPR